MRRYLALTCEALARTIYALSAETEHVVSIKLFRQGLHNHPSNLRHTLQEHIDAVTANDCDALLLVYGMCGLSTVGLIAKQVPIVIPRAHDCITLYLGSRERYQDEFDAHPGTYWYSVDYLERREHEDQVALGAASLGPSDEQYQAWVEKYDQETADMLVAEMRRWMQHYTRAAFIDMGLGDRARYEHMARQKAEQEGWVFERKQGDNRLLKRLINGDWNAQEFLVVPPGHRIKQAYDGLLIKAEPVGDA
jgi:hypothetical protein